MTKSEEEFGNCYNEWNTEDSIPGGSEERRKLVAESKAIHDIICGPFGLQEAIETSSEERLLRFGEVEFAISPFVYGESVHSSLAEMMLYVKDKYGLW